METVEKCFVIMPISDQGDYPEGHFAKVYDQVLKPAIEEAGYEAYRIDEDNICDSIIGKIFKAVQECPMALCDLSNRNPNVLYELGLRQAYDKPVVLVQDDKTERIFDVSGIKTVEYKHSRFYEDVMEARSKIKEALISTREGKENSVVKVVKANTADFSSVDVSNEDKISIMFNSIMTEIAGLKKQRNRRPFDYYQYTMKFGDDDSKDINEDHEYRGTYYVSLKKGVTNKQIETVTDEAKNMFSASISKYKDNNGLVVHIIAGSKADAFMAIQHIKNKLESKA